MIRTIPVSEARQSLPQLVGRMRSVMDRVVVTRNGVPAAVLMGIEEYEGWVETLEIAARPKVLRGVREGLADLKAGRARSFKEVFGEPVGGKSKRR